MNIAMAGIDYSLAGIDIRQQFSFTKARQQQVLEDLRQQPGVCGAVLLATCNRTELYLSCDEGLAPDPFALLCQASGIDFAACRGLYKVRRGSACFHHLCRLSCGALSQIWGEDQIITQVKNAIAFAREHQCADSVLEVLFRSAVTAAKRIKTEIRFTKSENSVATKTLEALQRRQPAPRSVLVIGNGEVGRLVAETLVAHGFAVSMTLRQYKYSQVQVPAGVEAFDYAQRYARMPAFDAVVSATLSPHCTVEGPHFAALPRRPGLLIDLAVPRDIDPACAALPGVALLDIDTLSGDAIREDHALTLKQIDGIAEKYHQDFLKWERFRRTAASGS